MVLRSASNVDMIASALQVEALQMELGETVPDVILIYLAEPPTHSNKRTIDYEQIVRLKKIWPDTACIAIIKDPQSRQLVRKLGADVVFFDGVSQLRLLQAIKDLELANRALSKQKEKTNEE